MPEGAEPNLSDAALEYLRLLRAALDRYNRAPWYAEYDARG